MAEASGLVSFDTSVPNVARIYDYWLGGKDNFAADREAAERSAKAVPQLPWLSRENRRFLGRAVRFCAGVGITQFLDIGSGLPTMDNVHEVAGQVAADPHVVYVDNDPVVISHAQALLSSPRTTAIRADLARPREILEDAEVRRLIDFGRPVAILIVATLHFVPDEADPAGAVARLRDAMVPGSYLVISHVEVSPAHGAGTQPRSETAVELGEAQRGTPMAPVRSREEIAAFFGDLTMLEPGLVDVWDWRPDSDIAAISSDFMTVLGGVARKDLLYPRSHRQGIAVSPARRWRATSAAPSRAGPGKARGHGDERGRRTPGSVTCPAVAAVLMLSAGNGHYACGQSVASWRIASHGSGEAG